MNPTDIFTNGDWMLSQSRTMSSRMGEKPVEVSFNVHWTFSQFKIMSLRRDDITAIDMGRLKNKETIMLPIICEVRKWQKQSVTDAIEDSEEHSVIWGMFMSATLQASVFMGRITQTSGIPSSKIQKISQ